MDGNTIIACFGLSCDDRQVEQLFTSLATHVRPEQPDDPMRYHDWVLVRRQGVELGFTDAPYQNAAPTPQWGGGPMLLTQAYFYAGFDDIAPWRGQLPHGLRFDDTRDAVRGKMAAFEATRRSWLHDTWDTDGYRFSVHYQEGGQRVDRIACRVLAAGLVPDGAPVRADVVRLPDVFGAALDSEAFRQWWPVPVPDDAAAQIRASREIDLCEECGATLGFTASADGPLLRSVIFHRNRDMESTGWRGELPLGLSFEDSPETLFAKITAEPVQQDDTELTGHAVWHFDDFTLHVLYSLVENRLLRVKVMAPGTWRSVMDI